MNDIHSLSHSKGHSYTVQVWVEAKNGYEFDASATAYNMKGYQSTGCYILMEDSRTAKANRK